jgi:hypothetical protein
MTSHLFGQCSRWDLACDTLQILAELAADHDDDGVDVFFLNSKHALKACVSPSLDAIIVACAVMTVFLPQISRGHNVRAIMQVAAPVLTALLNPNLVSTLSDSNAVSNSARSDVACRTATRPSFLAAPRKHSFFPHGLFAVAWFFCSRMDIFQCPSQLHRRRREKTPRFLQVFATADLIIAHIRRHSVIVRSFSHDFSGTSCCRSASEKSTTSLCQSPSLPTVKLAIPRSV